MKKLVITMLVAACAASALLTSVPARADWVLDGNAVFTADATAPGGGANPYGITHHDPTSPGISATASVAAPTQNVAYYSYSQSQSGIYGSYRQNFIWQNYGPPTLYIPVHFSAMIQGSATVADLTSGEASGYMLESGDPHGNLSDSTNNYTDCAYTQASAGTYDVRSDAGDTFAAHTTVQLGSECTITSHGSASANSSSTCTFSIGSY